MGTKEKLTAPLYFWCTLLMLCILPFSGKLNSICIMLLLAIWLWEGQYSLKFKDLLRQPFFVLNGLLFLLYLIGLRLSKDHALAALFIERNLSLVALPLLFLSKRKFKLNEIQILFKAFIGCIFLMMIVASILAMRDFSLTGDYHVFFYHTFARTVGKSAITASLLCSISLALLFYLPLKNKIRWTFVLLFSVWLILLASKLFLLVETLLLLLNVRHYLNLRKKLLFLLLLLTLGLTLSLTKNPVRKRFADMGTFPLSHLEDRVFSPSDYFDGLSLRLLYIRFSFEIMQEQQGYILGVGTGDAENLLKQKIIDHNMYIGNGTKANNGYLKYSFHNEYLQKFVQLGIIGLGLFLGVFFYCMVLAFKYKSHLLRDLLLIFGLSFFTDTAAETQLGLVSYLSFLCLALCLIRFKTDKNNH